MKIRNWFWGIFFMLSAVFVIVSQTVGFGQFGFWSIAATVFLVALLIHSLAELNYFGIFLPVAFLYKIYCAVFLLPDISIWKLLLAAVLASIGFEMIFHKHHKWGSCLHENYKDYKHISETVDDNHPSAKSSFGASSQYLHGDSIESGEFISSFGALEIYFDQAHLNPSGAEIYLDCNFGAIKLYVPKDWPVRDNIHVGLGAVDNTRIAPPDNSLPTLTLVGNTKFGAVEIHYI